MGYTYRCVLAVRRKQMVENGWTETEHFHVMNDQLFQVFRKSTEIFSQATLCRN